LGFLFGDEGVDDGLGNGGVVDGEPGFGGRGLGMGCGGEEEKGGEKGGGGEGVFHGRGFLGGVNWGRINDSFFVILREGRASARSRRIQTTHGFRDFA
jgi:hypothetical protein